MDYGPICRSMITYHAGDIFDDKDAVFTLFERGGPDMWKVFEE